MKTISIFKFDLSARATNILKRMNINNVYDFINTPISDFEKQRGVGKKTVDEIVDLYNRLTNGQIDFETYRDESQDLQENIEFSDEQLERFDLFSVSDLNLSARSSNCLARNNISTIKQLVMLSDEELNRLPQLGRKSVEEIKNVRKEWLINNAFLITSNNSDEDIPSEKKEFYERLSVAFDILSPIKDKELYNICLNNDIFVNFDDTDICNLGKEEYLNLFMKIDALNKGIVRYVDMIFSSRNGYIDEEEFTNIIVRDFQYDALRTAVYDYIISNVEFKKIGSYFVIKRIPLYEYVQSLDMDKKTCIVLERFDGLSLQELGDKYGLTRERVRQIIAKRICKFAPVMEDYYSQVFCHFKFNKSLFFEVFPNVEKNTYDYLATRYKKGDIELNRDNMKTYSGLYDYAIEDYLDKDDANKWRKGLTRQKIARIVLIKGSSEYFDKDSFEQAYCSFVSDNDLDIKKYSYNIYTLNNMFRNSEHVVFNREGEFRYYENDATSLWGKIDFTRYSDSVISAELIYRDYFELMDEYDIRNGYELFCLLKNTAYIGREITSCVNGVVFRRIPIMIIGDGNEEKQVLKLLRETAPIGYWDFYEAYEDRYGVRKDSASANLGGYIEQYYTGGEYNVDLPILTDVEKELIRKIVVKKPIWTITELEKIFENYCIESDLDTLNSVTLYDLGYSLNSGYAYSREYSNVMDCLDDYIFSNDVVDLNEIDSELARLSMFKGYVYLLRTTQRYYEIAPKVLVSKDFLLKEYGITEENLMDIRRIASHYYDDKFFNGNSLWEKIKDNQSVKLLKDNKWLCTSVLRQQEGVFSLPVAGAVILSLDKENLNVANICLWLSERDGKMTLEHMTEKVNEIFGSEFDKYKIASKIKEQGYEKAILTDGIDEYLNQLISLSDEQEDDLFREEFY